MNLVEALTREILRVAKLRRHYEDVGDAGKFALVLIDKSLEEACRAAGSDDATLVLASYQTLKEYQG
jgi:hypothetical protein